MKISAITFNGTERADIDKSQFSDDNLELKGYYQIEQTSRGEDNRGENRIRKRPDNRI
jgi:hypothetical protein